MILLSKDPLGRYPRKYVCNCVTYYSYQIHHHKCMNVLCFKFFFFFFTIYFMGLLWLHGQESAKTAKWVDRERWCSTWTQVAINPGLLPGPPPFVVGTLAEPPITTLIRSFKKTTPLKYPVLMLALPPSGIRFHIVHPRRSGQGPRTGISNSHQWGHQHVEHHPDRHAVRPDELRQWGVGSDLGEQHN